MYIVTTLFILISIFLIFLIIYYDINNKLENEYSNNSHINIKNSFNSIDNLISFFSLLFFIFSLILRFYY